MPKPTINESCIACGTCEAICPAVFKVQDVDNKHIATVLEADYAAEKANIDDAINSCPVQAIAWQE